MTEDPTLTELKKAVNASRYRGPDRKGPLVEKYHWPQSFNELKTIADAALQFVLAKERKESDSN